MDRVVGGGMKRMGLIRRRGRYGKEAPPSPPRGGQQLAHPRGRGPRVGEAREQLVLGDGRTRMNSEVMLGVGVGPWGKRW